MAIHPGTGEPDSSVLFWQFHPLPAGRRCRKIFCFPVNRILLQPIDPSFAFSGALYRKSRIPQQKAPEKTFHMHHIRNASGWKCIFVAIYSKNMTIQAERSDAVKNFSRIFQGYFIMRKRMIYCWRIPSNSRKKKFLFREGWPWKGICFHWSV